MCNSGSSTAHGHVGGHTAEPVDAVIDRLNDPAVAASMVTMLDNADLLSTLVLGLAGFMERGDTSPETVDLLSLLSEAAAEGAATAKSNDTRIEGALGAYRAFKDPDVQRGLGLFVEIARALGRRL